MALLTLPVRPERIRPEGHPIGLPGAAALLFVAYTGYGRIATLGEEVRDPTIEGSLTNDETIPGAPSIGMT